VEISARNQLKAVIKSIKEGPVSTEVVLDLDGQQLVSVITTTSAHNLNLKLGDNVSAIIKSSSVMLGK